MHYGTAFLIKYECVAAFEFGQNKVINVSYLVFGAYDASKHSLGW